MIEDSLGRTSSPIPRICIGIDHIGAVSLVLMHGIKIIHGEFGLEMSRPTCNEEMIASPKFRTSAFLEPQMRNTTDD